MRAGARDVFTCGERFEMSARFISYYREGKRKHMHRLIERCSSACEWEKPDDMSELMHGLLQRRGIRSEEEARAFLHPNEHQLHDPYLLPGIKEAVERILEARENFEDVCVFGDYDVDGVSASALLSTFLKKEMGMRVGVYIPSRHEEGYGLNDNAVIQIAKDATLLITVDCGISCAAEVRLAKSLGMDVIVTDHHRPGDNIPEGIVIDPLLGDYPFQSLCGAGVAFKLICALSAVLEREAGEQSQPSGWRRAQEYIDLAALATVADLVPLTDENRVIVSLGLKKINAQPRTGIKALIAAAGLEGRTISAGNIGFQIAPRLNASGRLGDARRALTLLTALSDAEAAPIAQELEQENLNRRSCEQKIVDEALEMMKNYDLLEHKIIVLMGSDWNSGVIGLAASRLVTKYFYPVILLSEKDGVCTGSCRSIPGVDIFAALTSCADLFVKYGGHKQAAGLTIERGKVEELIARLDEYIRENVLSEEYVPQLEYDIELTLDAVHEDAVRQMELLQPTGFGNPSPVILSDVWVDSVRAVGKEGAHLQMKLSDDFGEVPAICFGEGARAGELSGQNRKMLHAPQLNVWRDRVSVQCEVKNILESDSESVFDAFESKFARFLRLFLTEVLYNKNLNHLTVKPEKVPLSLVSAWLKRYAQGTAIVAASKEGARHLREFLGREYAQDTIEVHAGRWSEDARAFNAAFLCPCGVPKVRYERVILWDAPKEAFAALPQGELLQLNERLHGEWMNRLPAVDRMRQIFVAARSITRSGAMLRMTAADVENEVARAANGHWLEAAAALAALRSMNLISAQRERLELLPSHKTDPMRDPVYRRINAIREYASGKG